MTLQKINSLRSLDLDWDGEGGVPVSNRIANLAAEAVELGVEQAAQTETRWLPPSVSSTPEGGIDLSWRIDNRRALLILQPDREGVVCVIKTGNEEPQRQILSLGDAVVAITSILKAR